MGVVEEEDFHGWVVDGSGTRSGAMGSPRLLLCDSPPQGLETTAYASCGSEPFKPIKTYSNLVSYTFGNRIETFTFSRYLIPPEIGDS